jgi:hypothetical protein
LVDYRFEGLSSFMKSFTFRPTRTFALVLALVPYIVVTWNFILDARLPVQDSYYFHYPVFEYIGDSLAAAQFFPEWIPVGGGIRPGSLQISLLYFLPHRVFGYALQAAGVVSPVVAYKLQYALGVLLLGGGWWLFLEQWTGSRLAASFGTIALVMGGTGITLHQEQILGTSYLVPWFLYAVGRLDKDRRLVFALALMFGLAGTLHYPHIFLISFVVFTVVMFIFYPKASARKVQACLGPQLLPALLLFLLAVAPALYVLTHMGEFQSPLRASQGTPAVADSYEAYLSPLVNNPRASAIAAEFPHYLMPGFPSGLPDLASYFVGRPALIMALAAVLLAPWRALPVVVMVGVFGLLALGIHSPVPIVEALFAASPEIVGLFRQWFHFFVMINFCLSALAALGLALAIARFRDVLSRVGPAVLVLLFGLQLADLAAYDRAYLAEWSTIVERRAGYLLTAGEHAVPSWGISGERTLLQYGERLRADACCASALPSRPIITNRVRSITGGAETHLATLRALPYEDDLVAVVDAPVSSLTPVAEMADGELEAQVVTQQYRFDGLDLEVVADRPAILILPINYALGLEARIDDEPIAVWRVNAALSGVLVPQGVARVEVRVVPDLYGWIAFGQVLCVVGLFALLSSVVYRAVRTE